MKDITATGHNVPDVRESAWPIRCPEEGEFVGYKAAHLFGTEKYVIVELLIPANAKRSSAYGNKCRCSEAKVLAIYDTRLVIGKKIEGAKATSLYGRLSHGPEIVYVPGETVYPDSWDPDRFNECSHGIHFFMTYEEAYDYIFHSIFSYY